MNGISNVITAIVMLVCGAPTDTLVENFQEMGFETSKAGDGMLMLTGEKALFAEKFGLEITIVEKTKVMAMNDEQLSAEWPADAMPDTLSQYIKRVEFEQPMEFGPSDY